MLEAVSKDINKEYIAAVTAYEKCISADVLTPLDCYINLAFLYWAFACEHIEFNIPNSIPDEWGTVGSKRCFEIIAKGISLYPDSVEVHFWRRYFKHRLYHDDFTEQECKNIIENYSDKSVVPFFFLRLFDRANYKTEILILLQQALGNPTAKNLYIKSFLN
ncbi:hypothetical protein [Mucilaginibacter defluvii]|uniref:Uncharacterized protein n=1 Tax=Mucilaginibacter defluvii TaxID=1196019 RepID=A0ABP9FUD0_9SPHI